MVKVLYLALFLIIFNAFSCLALSGNITAFRDGTSNFNISANTTKEITIPLNSTINTAILSIKGFSGGNYFNKETPDQNLSDGNWSTTYPINKSYDSDWSTTASVNPGNWNYAYAYFNYSNPDNRAVKWEIKDEVARINLSVDSCSKYPVLQFKITSFINLTMDQVGVIFDCKNSAGNWVNLRQTNKSGGVSYTHFYEDQVWYGNFPDKVYIFSNNSLQFSHLTNLTGTNYSINLNTSEMTNHTQTNGTFPIRFYADSFGLLNIFNLTVNYFKSDTAIVSFTSPAQITINSIGGNYPQLITVQNTGDYNASNCSFQTVSSGTPNYNGKLEYNVFSIENNTNTSVTLTFTQINQDSEPDEKLQFYCVDASQTSDTVYSDFIDLDITYNVAGGGGGSGPTGSCNIEVIRPYQKKIILLGKEGLQRRSSFVLRNNGTSTQTVSFVISGVNCKLDKPSINLQGGNSVSTNYILCTFPPNDIPEEGFLEIRSEGCTSKINIILKSNLFGSFISYLNGAGGLVPQLIIIILLAVIVIAFIYLLNQI